MSDNLWMILNALYVIVLMIFLLNLFIKTKFKRTISIVTSFICLGLNYFACIVIFLSQSISYAGSTMLLFCGTLLVTVFTYVSITGMRIKNHLKIHMISSIGLLIIATLFVLVVFITKYIV